MRLARLPRASSRLGGPLRQCQCHNQPQRRFASSQQSPQQQAREHARAAHEANINESLQADDHGADLRVDPASKTIHTAVGSLPASPVMDPAWMEARDRYKKPKSKPGPKSHEQDSEAQAPGRFRKKLHLNPYAQALATPWRRCVITETGMPRYFYQEFEAVTNPETGAPWWVPGDLTGPQHGEELADTHGQDKENPAGDPNTTSTERETQIRKDNDDNTPQSSASEPVSSTSPTTSPSSTKTPPAKSTTKTSPPRAGPHGAPRGYVLSRKDLISALGGDRRATKLGGSHLHMLVRRARLARTGIAQRLVWRQDMDDVVLDLMRRRIVSQLHYLARLSEDDDRSLVVPVEGWGDIDKSLFQRGCVLWHSRDVSESQAKAKAQSGSEAEKGIGASGGTQVEASTDPGETSGSGPGQYATLDIPNAKYEKKLPVHNLYQLLGEEHLASLRQHPLFRDHSLVVLRKSRSIPLQLALWKLQGYLADYQKSPSA